MQEIPVFFLRGLSTKGLDDIRFAFIYWGQMHVHLERELAKRGVKLIPVLGMGAGLLDEQAHLAVDFLRAHPLWNSSQKFHLLGHSAGGLIGKKVLALLAPEEASRNIFSLVTIATPHGGSYLAEACLQAPIRHPVFTWLLKKIGFDIRNGFPFYLQLTPATQIQEFSSWHAPPGIKTASITAAGNWRIWSWPFWIAKILRMMREIPTPHDGLLESKSQTFGQNLGHFDLDHLTQLGVYGRSEFSKMCDRLAEYFRTTT
jgi:hypothetical protein